MSKFDGTSRFAARGWGDKALKAQLWAIREQRKTAGMQRGERFDEKGKEDGGQQSKSDDATASG